MPISMSPSAHYVTQQSSLNRITLGPLTDRKIKRYMKLGWYGQGGILWESKQKTKKKAARRKKLSLDQLVNY